MQRGAWLCLWARDNTETLCCLQGLQLLPGHGVDLQEVRAAHRLQVLGSGLAGADHHKNITKKHTQKNKSNFSFISQFVGFSEDARFCCCCVCVFIRLVLSWRCYKIKTIFAKHCQKHRAAAVSIGCCNKLLVPLISPNQVSCCDASGFPGNGCSPCFIPLPSPFCRGQIGWIHCSYHRCLKNKASGFFQHERSRISRCQTTKYHIL